LYSNKSLLGSKPRNDATSFGCFENNGGINSIPFMTTNENELSSTNHTDITEVTTRNENEHLSNTTTGLAGSSVPPEIFYCLVLVLNLGAVFWWGVLAVSTE